MELIWQFQTKPEQGNKRCYGKWLDSGRYGTSNTGDIAEMAINWMVSQGACSEEDRYDTNSGRKSLALWCEKLNIPYPESFQIHGDHQDTWLKYYQKSLKHDRTMRQRTQSRHPEDCIKALNRFATYAGRGTAGDPENMDAKEKLLALLGRKLGAHREVAEILLNL